MAKRTKSLSNQKKDAVKPVLVMGVIGADCHAVGNRILEMVFGQAGFKVVNLGVMVSQDEFIAAALETGARAILVSSLYGHGEIDCLGFRDRCLERGLDRIVLYIGGNLVIGKSDFKAVESKFRTMGFDRVFPSDCDLDQAVLQLKKDLNLDPS
jgi:methylaspartate mutase sigma subunit